MICTAIASFPLDTDMWTNGHHLLPCRGWLVPSPHIRPCSEISSPSFPASLCSWKLTISFHRCVWIIAGAAERNHFRSCCVTHTSFPLETRLIWNSTSLHASGQKWLLLNLYVKICNNLSITKWCYRHPGAQGSSHTPQWTYAHRYVCTYLLSSPQPAAFAPSHPPTLSLLPVSIQ